MDDFQTLRVFLENQPNSSKVYRGKHHTLQDNCRIWDNVQSITWLLGFKV